MNSFVVGSVALSALLISGCGLLGGHNAGEPTAPLVAPSHDAPSLADGAPSLPTPSLLDVAPAEADTAAPVADSAPSVHDPAPIEPAAESETVDETVEIEPRVYSPAGLVTIHHEPDRDSSVIGGIRAGQSVKLRSTALPHHHTLKRLYDCDTGWYPVVPRGYVCVGGPAGATLDGEDPRVVASAAALPDLGQDYPYKVGVSVGAPQYLRIPTAAEQRVSEPGLDDYLKDLPAADDDKGGAIDNAPAGRPPTDAFLKYQAFAKPALTHEQEAYDGYKISWSNEFDANGRTWLLTADMTLVPKDKVRQKALPTFKGIDLKKNPQIELPLAFFWLEDTTKFVKNAEGELEPTDEKWKRHEFIETTTNQAKGPGGVYWQTKSGEYVRYQDVSIIRAAKSVPSGVGDSGKWIEARVTWGYLIAYEGDKPVYATAMSPGVDGIAARRHATARGKHFVDWKMYSGDMSGRDKGKDWFVDEVPWVQYYKDNYAVHGAWWHNDFGRPKSHGCVNLAPADARALFAWMDPVIPEGWYAVSTYYPHSTGTLILIRH